MTELEKWAKWYYDQPLTKQPGGTMHRRVPYMLENYRDVKLFEVHWDDMLGERVYIPPKCFVWHEDECVLQTNNYLYAVQKYNALKGEIKKECTNI